MLAPMSDEDASAGARLISLAVHELRTPHNVVSGTLRMLLGTPAGKTGDAARRLLELADRSSARVTALLADLSEIAKIDAGSLVLAAQPVDLDTLIDEAVAAFEPPPESAAIVERGTRAPGLRVTGDVPRLRRAIVACLTAVARELPGEGLVVSVSVRTNSPEPGMVSVTLGGRQALDALPAGAASWGPLDEWRGGLGLELPLARRVIERAGGRLCSPAGTRRPAILLVLPWADR
jgi:signal transduction histidine kinase